MIRAIMIKRLADLLEKVAAGSFLIGLFQGQNLAIFFGLWTLAATMALTWAIERKAK